MISFTSAGENPTGGKQPSTEGKLSEQVHQPAEKGPVFADTRICSSPVSPDTTSSLSLCPQQQQKKVSLFALLTSFTCNLKHKQATQACTTLLNPWKQRGHHWDQQLQWQRQHRPRISRASPGEPALLQGPQHRDTKRNRCTVRKIKIAMFSLLFLSSQAGFAPVLL